MIVESAIDSIRDTITNCHARYSGVNHPVEYGGLGLDLKFNIAMNEELGNIECGAVPMSIAVQTDMSTPALARFGSDRLKKEFLEPSIKGEYVSCLGVSEPGGGSDVAAITTNATRKGDDFVINGQKMWITNGGHASFYFVLARTDPDPKCPSSKAFTGFIVDRGVYCVLKTS